MRKAIIAPLCSALVVPGLGQIINQQPRKGGAILAAVFLLLAAAVIRLLGAAQAAFDSSPATGGPSLKPFVTELLVRDAWILWLLLAAFALLWLYSVADAFRWGLRLDRQERDRSGEILPDR